MNRPNIILFQDHYKYTHPLQLPDKVEEMESYIEARGTSINVPYARFFGLQIFILKYLQGKVLEQWMIDEATVFLKNVFGYDYFNRDAFQKLLDKHDGVLPVEIKAVPEGKKIPVGNVLVTIHSTDTEFPWLVTWMETMLLRAVWYPTTVCTISSAVKDIERKYSAITGSPDNPFFLNDFGARGVSSHESAEIGGSAHLVNYLGTDTAEGLLCAQRYYGDALGYSVFASEHSTTTIYTKDGEDVAYDRFLTIAPDDATESIVIDSYDTENAVKNILGGKLKNKILARKGRTVFRPDSGEPTVVPILVIQWLWNIFGGHINEKGYKVLHNNVRCLQGDGISLQTIPKILDNLIAAGFATENIIFGMGGKLLQGVDRDTLKFACKLSHAVVDGVPRDIYKQPKTDSTKNSKKGQLKLIYINGEYKTVNINEYPEYENILQTVFKNGIVTKTYTFSEVKNNE